MASLGVLISILLGCFAISALMVIIFRNKKDQSYTPTGIAAGVSVIFVPVMGATSLFFALLGDFNQLAVMLGVAIFIAQWVWVFRSQRFQRYWSMSLFKIAFIANSLLRIPLSIYLDPALFWFLLTIYGKTNHVDGGDVSTSFIETLYLTLSQGVAVQMVYAICLSICYGIVILCAKLFRKLRAN